MNLAAYEQMVMRVLFAPQAGSDELTALGAPARWEMYREMVRGRLLAMAEIAFKRTRALVGTARFTQQFDDFLACTPPASRLIRDVILAFGERWHQHAERADGTNCADLLAFECAKWDLAYRKVDVPVSGRAGVRELDFEGRLVLNPALVLLRLRHPVHEDGKEREPRPLPLLIYRPPGIDEVRWWSPSELFAALVECALGGAAQPLGSQVRGVATQLGLALDQPLIEQLSLDLALAVERGVVVGVRD